MMFVAAIYFLLVVDKCHPLLLHGLKLLPYDRRSAFKHSQSALSSTPKSKQSGSNLPDLSQSRFPTVPENGYDFIVVGSGPAGEAAAVRAAQLGARVAVVEKK